MAIWQATIFLSKANRRITYSDSKFLNYLKELEKVFPEEKSWHKSIKQYGKLDSTCIEIFLLNMEIEDISVRIDLRSISEYQLRVICEFANKNDLLIKYGDEFHETNISNLTEIIKKSDAHKFIINPKRYLTEDRVD